MTHPLDLADTFAQPVLMRIYDTVSVNVHYPVNSFILNLGPANIDSSIYDALSLWLEDAPTGL